MLEFSCWIIMFNSSFIIVLKFRARKLMILWWMILRRSKAVDRRELAKNGDRNEANKEVQMLSAVQLAANRFIISHLGNRAPHSPATKWRTRVWAKLRRCKKVCRAFGSQWHSLSQSAGNIGGGPYYSQNCRYYHWEIYITTCSLYFLMLCPMKYHTRYYSPLAGNLLTQHFLWLKNKRKET